MLSLNGPEAIVLVWPGRVLRGFFVLLALQACAAHRADELAAEYGMSSVSVAGQPFQHQVFLQRGSGKLLHVYLEGDGRPWSKLWPLVLSDVQAATASSAGQVFRTSIYRPE